MEIIDAQIHPPHASVDLPAELHEHELLISCELAREAMDSVGVDVALINGPEDFVELAIARYPDRFLGCLSANPQEPDLDAFYAGYRSRPGMLAVRARVVDWATRTLQPDFAAGRLEPVFAAAERHQVPVFCSAMGVAAALGPVAEAHPALTLIADHTGLSSHPPMRLVDPDPFSTLEDVLSLARYPNVALKFSGVTALSREPWPHREIWPSLHRIVDAFGPERLMWGSDFTRLRMGAGTTDRGPREDWGGLYSEVVHLLRDTDELSESDKETIFSGTFRRLLRWPRETGSRA